MKKIIKNPIFTFVLGAIIFAGITGVAAYNIFADDIKYQPSDTTWNVTNVKDAMDELYIYSKTTISNLNEELDKYKSLTIQMWATTTNNSGSSTSRLILYSLANKYKYFKITEVTNLQNSKQCYLKAWSSAKSTWFDLNLNQQYEVYSSTDGYKYNTLTVWNLSNSNGTEARCQASVEFYN